MLQVPANLISQYTTFIEQRGVKDGQHRYYVKWLRYYLDFCHKYNLIRTKKESLHAFTGKLKEKKQAENFRKQAHHAISLFYELEHCSGKKNPNSTSSDGATTLGRAPLKTSPLCTQQRTTNQANRSSRTAIVHTAEPLPRTDIVFKQSGADWTEVFNELKNAIKMRHYSPKTLKAYSGWTRKFQAYTKSKDPRLVSVDDVKNFLTWLAVGKGVSASSQNQGFNALLFLFRNVFHKEFGKIDGIVWLRPSYFRMSCASCP